MKKKKKYLNGCDWSVELDVEEDPVGPDCGGDNGDFKFSPSLSFMNVFDALDVQLLEFQLYIGII